ncbi:MAG: CDP-alcohol phosphatidyltransferase family protein [Chlamydiales bacterium]|nr:CDP-alcohol phosphatidyltransferase family protein [Chlamydiales bacterium]
MKFALFLTLIRMFISPFFIGVYLFYEKLGISLITLPYILLTLLLMCELSDIFDGIVARRYDEVTDLGKILDPMADSIVRLSLLLGFTKGFVQLPFFLVLVFVYRDSIISTLRTLCALRGEALAARTSGKIKAIIQAITVFTIVFLMIPYSQGWISLERLQNLSFYMVLFAAIYTVGSGVEYIMANRSFIKKAWS